jgi:hypothetical protein
MNQKHGEMGWNDSSFASGESRGSGGGGKDRFLKLKPGSNLIRVLTAPYQYYQHKYKFEGEKGFGHRIPCSAKFGSCPVCAKGDKPKKRWYLGVIDRSSNSYKILDVSWSVLSDIQTYAQDADWGNPIEYDFDIVVNPHGGPQNYYKAVAKPKRPLSATDLVQKEQVNIEYLESRCAPPDPSKVEERFSTLEQEYLQGGGNQSDQSRVNAPVSFGSNTTDDSDDFPDSDAKSIPF